ncbi:MAG: hypothetical protein NUV65_00850 [Candidatus Roizmanbacteria bacterium]|nr:hypothetical protein [Candidatus Roizmanbacteria bacterium]
METNNTQAVRIDEELYIALKEIATEDGKFLTRVLNESAKLYITARKQNKILNKQI